MKKKLFLQSICTCLVSLIITILIMLSTTNLLATIKDINIKDARIQSQSAVIKNNDIVYSTISLPSFEKQNFLIAVATNSDFFSHKSIEYSITKKEFPDGTILVQMTPSISIEPLLRIILIYAIILYLITYLIIAVIVQKKNNNDIVVPLNNLKIHTEILSDGNFEINIPDEGCDEISFLAKAIENLRIRLKKEVYMNKKSSENRKFLISSMSHDLRTPVTSLRGYLEGISDGIANTKEKHDLYISKAIDKTNLINQMISDMLLYSKLDLNQVDFKYQLISVSEYIKNYVDESSILFNKKQCKIFFHDETKSEYFVRIDIQQFDRVLANITENAIKYIPEETGTVEYIIRENNYSVIIEIKDNGSGIEKEDLNKIFDKFYRCEKSRQIKGSSGLGLAISKQIIENMGGQIWAVSEHGKGTSILISLKKAENGEQYYEKNTNN